MIYELASRFIGLTEVSGSVSHPQILAMLQLDSRWPSDDSVPWCSAFANHICWLADKPRSKSLRARSWLLVGDSIPIEAARRGDVVVLKRGENSPGPDVIDAKGHVGFYVSHDATHVSVLGGNQSDAVSIRPYPLDRLLGVRRL